MQNDEHFINYYSRLLKDFASEVGNGDFRNIPQPFLPTFGDRYSSAARRIAFVGIETRGWGDAAEFLDKLSRSDPADLIRANLEEFRELEFVDWTNNFGSTFFDFVIAFLLLSNGFSPNLSAFKRQPNKEILRDFAWGNFNSVEEYETTAARGNASRPDWQCGVSSRWRVSMAADFDADGSPFRRA